MATRSPPPRRAPRPARSAGPASAPRGTPAEAPRAPGSRAQAAPPPAERSARAGSAAEPARPLLDLDGAVALVTGGSRGIGRATCLALAAAGADVAVNYASHAAEAKDAAEEVRALGRKAVTVHADVSRRGEVEAMVRDTVRALGGLDVLVNNAGIVESAPFLEMREELWDRVLAVNLKGQFLCGQAAARHMVDRGRGGSIVNVASIASGGIGVGFPGAAHYVASKGAVVALTENMALELAPHRIRVNAVAPGFITTDMTRGYLADEGFVAGVMPRIPLGRVGEPREVANLAVFLASEAGSYCTGATFYVDGGWLSG